MWPRRGSTSRCASSTARACSACARRCAVDSSASSGSSCECRTCAFRSTYRAAWRAFRRRRCDFGAAELRVDEAPAAGVARVARARSGGSASRELRARLAAGRIELSARARVGDSAGGADRARDARAGGRTAPGRAHHRRAALRVSAGAGAALGLGIARRARRRAGRQEPRRWCVDGTGELSLNPLELLLWRALPPAGWRLPRYRHAAPTARRRRRAGDRVALRRRRGSDRARSASRTMQTCARPRRCWRAAICSARAEAFARTGAGHGDDVVAAERHLAVLAALPARCRRSGDARRAARRCASRAAAARCARWRAIEAERGLIRRRRRATLRLPSSPKRAGERDDALAGGAARRRA